MLIKRLVKKYFETFSYFYTKLKYRVFIVMVISIIIGILDGLGLSLFLPLLQLVNDSSSVESKSLGNLSFLIDLFMYIGLPLTLLPILCLMAAFFLIKGGIQYIAGVYKVNVQQWFIRSLRSKNIKGLNNLDYKYFVMSDVGRIQNSLTGEIGRVANAFKDYFDALQYGILVIVYMSFAFFVDPQFAILVSIGGVLTNFLYKNLYKNTRGISRTLTGESNVFQGLIIQNVSNYKYLKATGSLENYSKKLQKSVVKLEESNKKIGRLDALLSAGREPILIIVVVAVIYIQISLLGSSLAPILISLLFFYRALGYLMQMQVRWNKFLSMSGSLENIQLFEKELRNNRESPGKAIVNEEISSLEMNHVSFFYQKHPVLSNISLSISKEETVAFVGESGSGKTTLVNILAGLLPVEEGIYSINGLDSKKNDLRSVQKRIGYITQDPVIFNDTVFNNISFWGDKIPENLERFWHAVKQSAIFDFVNSLPEKENTVLGNNGINLSGGQRQRISIARELYKEVEILILDEATSALDSETEKAIQLNIENLKGQYTILIVAHRIATIKNADRIVVMKNGRISKVNSFNELLQESAYFKRLVELQEV